MQLIAKGNGISIVRLAAGEEATVVDSYGGYNDLSEQEIKHRIGVGAGYKNKATWNTAGPMIVILKGEDHFPPPENEFGIISP